MIIGKGVLCFFLFLVNIVMMIVFLLFSRECDFDGLLFGMLIMNLLLPLLSFVVYFVVEALFFSA